MNTNGVKTLLFRLCTYIIYIFMSAVVLCLHVYFSFSILCNIYNSVKCVHHFYNQENLFTILLLPIILIYSPLCV